MSLFLAGQVLLTAATLQEGYQFGAAQLVDADLPSGGVPHSWRPRAPGFCHCLPLSCHGFRVAD